MAPIGAMAPYLEPIGAVAPKLHLLAPNYVPIGAIRSQIRYLRTYNSHEILRAMAPN